MLRENLEPIHIDGLTKRFDEETALDGLSLTVAQGEVFGLVGPDGAGKTTTMRLLTGILLPTAGSAHVAGFDVVKDPEQVKEHIGYVSQRFGLYADLTVNENVDFYADIYGVTRQARAERSTRLLEFSGLSAFGRRRAGDLSGGMKQKLALTCALIHTPRVLFLDEPTSGVDPVSRRDFWKLLYQLLRQNVTIFVSTAYLDEAERCSRVALLDRGKLLALGTPEEVKRLMKGDILEVRSPRPRETSAVLRKEFPQASVGLFADRVHVGTEEPEKVQPRIRPVLEAHGIELEEVKTIEPTLEDVFISILGGRTADG
jgi:ABC-2 type transport system ATP-binding protein